LIHLLPRLRKKRSEPVPSGPLRTAVPDP
jgi:hypothetical protein